MGENHKSRKLTNNYLLHESGGGEQLNKLLITITKNKEICLNGTGSTSIYLKQELNYIIK